MFGHVEAMRDIYQLVIEWIESVGRESSTGKHLLESYVDLEKNEDKNTRYLKRD